MSRLAGLFIILLGSTALADPSDPPATPAKTEETTPAARSSKFPFKVVKVLADSEQALLFDKTRGRHVLVEVGDTVGDYTVNAIDATDGVTLQGKEMPVEIQLPVAAGKKPRKAKELDTAVVDGVPEDPYGAIDAKVFDVPDDATPAKPVAKKPATRSVPADPYAEDDIRAVSATDGSEQPNRGPEGDRTITASNWGELDNETPEAAKPVKPAKPVAPPHTDVWVAGGSKAKADAQNMPVEPETKTDVAAAGPTTISKKAFRAALTDFGVLAAAIDASFTAKGLELAKVQDGSIFAKAGLTAGDVITSVDGKPLRSLDDAADLYARAGSMKSATVQLTRAGKPQTLRIVIQ